MRSVPAMLARAAPILKRLPARNPVMVEVGTAGGLLAAHLLDQCKDLMLTCVDSWAASEDQPLNYVRTGDGHARMSGSEMAELKVLALQRLRLFGHRAKIVQVRSPEAADARTVRLHEPYDLVFLDADHSYEAVSADLAAWWPLVRAGGWLGGHDHSWPSVQKAVNQWAATVDVDIEPDAGNTWWVRRNGR